MPNDTRVLVKESIPLLGKGPDEVAAAVRVVLSNNRTTRKLVLEVGKPIIIEKLVPKEEVPEETGHTLYEMTRNQPMQEHVIEGDRSAFQHLWEMAEMILSEGFSLGFILIGDKYVFQKWLKITIPVTRMIFFGVPVMQQAQIESDVFVLCGVDKSDPEEITFSVKATIP